MAAPQTQSKLVRWIDSRLPIFTFLNHELNEYPTPKNLSYWWNYGSLAGIMLTIMILTGISWRWSSAEHRARLDSVERSCAT